MDRGIWAAWYDLPDEGKEEYLAWLHEVHIPEALARPGYLWAAHVENGIWEKRESDLKNRLTYTDDTAVPAGNAYLMLYGAVSPHTFFDPSPSEMAEKQTADTREMLGRRNGERSCIFTEEARVDGPEVATRAPGLTPGPIIQMGSFNSNKPENEEELGIWYAQWRLPSEGRMTGCVGARKLVSAAGWAKHSILYEFVSMEAVDKYFVGHDLAYPEKAAFTDRVVSNLIHAPGSPSLGTRIWPPAQPSA